MLNTVIVALAAIVAISPVNAIWPVPQQISTGNAVLSIDKSIKVTYNGETILWDQGSPSGNQKIPTNSEVHGQVARNASDGASLDPFSSKEIVKGGVTRSLEVIFEHGLVPWMLNPAGSDFEPAVDSGKKVKSLNIMQTGKDNPSTFKPLAGSVDESYTLDLNLAGESSITANTSTGILRGLETLTQLFFKHSSGIFYTKLAPVLIQDAPRFPYRSILLDLARNWFTVDDIQRTIDGLAMNKMNILHLHITDTQSWPLEIPALPELAKKGRFAPGLTYSPADIKAIQEYGVTRGVQIILEIDMPGHVGIEKAYPGLSVAYNEKPYGNYCSEPPCGAFRLNNTNVEEFISTLFNDLLPRLSPYASYFHTGGDEYAAANSLLDPNLRTANMAVLKPILQRFLDHAHNKIREHGLVPMVWEEMVIHWEAKVGSDTVIQSWSNSTVVKKLAQAGYNVIDSSPGSYYLDCGRGTWMDYPDNKVQPDTLFGDWCSPTKNWRVVYIHDPVEGMTAEVAKNVIGGEVAVWTESIDSTNLDTLVWPRAAAAGEAWWSGRKDYKGKPRSVYGARPRLSEMRQRMIARGVKGAAITHMFCEQSPLGDCV